MQNKITPALKSSVNAYLMARAFAETEREKVDTIQREILETAAYYSDPNLQLTSRRVAGERITDVSLVSELQTPL